MINITDISGRQLAGLKVQLSKGDNVIRIPAMISNGNVYIASLMMQGKKHVVKFLKR